MYIKNDASNEYDILQNQFTSFLSFAINNARIDYIRAKIKRLQREQVTEQYEILFAEKAFQIEDFTDNEAISQAIRRIHEKERYVFLSRVLEEKKFKEIAAALNMSEKGVAAIYYATEPSSALYGLRSTVSVAYCLYQVVPSAAVTVV